MKFLDLFAGIGGFRLGMERAGHECVGYVEIDKFARKSYQAIHDTEGEWTREDITKVTDEEWDEKNDKEIAEYVAFLKGLSEVDGMRHKIVQVGFLADKGEELIKLLDDGWKILTSTYVGDNIEQIGGLVQYVLRKEVAE